MQPLWSDPTIQSMTSPTSTASPRKQPAILGFGRRYVRHLRHLYTTIHYWITIGWTLHAWGNQCWAIRCTWIPCFLVGFQGSCDRCCVCVPYSLQVFIYFYLILYLSSCIRVSITHIHLSIYRGLYIYNYIYIIIYIRTGRDDGTYHLGLQGWTRMDWAPGGALCGVRADGNRFSIHSQALPAALQPDHEMKPAGYCGCGRHKWGFPKS